MLSININIIQVDYQSVTFCTMYNSGGKVKFAVNTEKAVKALAFVASERSNLS